MISPTPNWMKHTGPISNRRFQRASQQTFILMKTSWRRPENAFRLLEDVLIKTNIFTLLIRFQKTSSRRLDQDQYIRLGHTFSRNTEGVFITSSRPLQYILPKKYYSVFLTSSRLLPDILPRRLQDVFKTFSRRFQDIFKTPSRHLQDVLLRPIQDVLQKRLQDIFKTFWKRFQDVSSS